jgi:hypothetical protein
VQPNRHVLEQLREPPERRWRSVEAALAFYFLWGPRLQSARTRNFYSLEELVSATGDGSPSHAEDLRLSVADVGRCLAELDDEESLCLSVTFGISPGARRELQDGVLVYVEDETILSERRATRDAVTVRRAATGLDAATRAFDSDAPGRRRVVSRAPRDADRRERGELSWKEAARRMGWVAPSGEADHKKVQRVLGRARAKVRAAMVERGMLYACDNKP